MMRAIVLSVIGLLVLLSSCEENIDVSLPGSDKKIVIEGAIENGKKAEVIITRNIPLFTSTGGTSISDFFVFDAQVYVSAAGITDTLTLTIDSASAMGVVYKGHVLDGIAGQVYQLTVIENGKTYTSQTTIPQPVALDSVYFKPEAGTGDTLGFAWAHLSEPAGLGNNYRFYSKRPRDRRFCPPFGATFDDKYVDGKSFDFAYTRSYDPTDSQNTFNTENDTIRGYYTNHDTVYIRFCSIDLASKEFYTTFETAQGSNGNPFASPVTIMGNISNGALGVWAGFGATYDTIMPH